MNSSAYMKKRTFKLLKSISLLKMEYLTQVLTNELGIHSVQYAPSEQSLIISYDATKLHYRSIELMLINYKCSINNGWLHSIQAHWYEYLDMAAQDNAHAPPPACCNKAPKGHSHVK